MGNEDPSNVARERIDSGRRMLTRHEPDRQLRPRPENDVSYRVVHDAALPRVGSIENRTRHRAYPKALARGTTTPANGSPDCEHRVHNFHWQEHWDWQEVLHPENRTPYRRPDRHQ